VRLAFIQLVDGAPVGQGDSPVTIPLSLDLSASVCVGSDAGAPVMTDYKPPFAFTGTLALMSSADPLPRSRERA
jgi:hypothetical protein